MRNDDEDDIGSIEASPLVITNMMGGNETKDDIIADLLGIPTDDNHHRNDHIHIIDEEEHITESSYLENDIIPNPNADNVDLSLLRGVGEMKQHAKPDSDNDGYNNNNNTGGTTIGGTKKNNPMAGSDDTDLENLAELVPDIKTRTLQQLNGVAAGGGMDMINHNHNNNNKMAVMASNSTKVIVDNDQQQVELVNAGTTTAATGMMMTGTDYSKRHAAAKIATTPQSMKTVASNNNNNNASTDYYFMSKNHDSMNMNPNNHDSMDWSRNKKNELDLSTSYKSRAVASPVSNTDHSNHHHNDDDDYADSEHALEDSAQNHHILNTGSGGHGVESKIPNEFMNIGSSANSISTATQTHEVRMPMYLPTFKPATGCTNASDFIVRCFVARLRSGITVVKHGRSRWCKSRLRVLHIHPDGRSLSWKPAEGEPSSSKRPPKLDLSTCLEVRHAWSPDPQNPMYTGTPILRQKCEAANAHKSFALIFKQRTVDITAVTADQCKVLMEGFSALCFRLQVANLAGRNNNGNNSNGKKNGGQQQPHARPMPEEDGVSTTASATLTNTSVPKVRP